MINLDFVQVPVSALIELEGANLKVYSIIFTCCKLNNNKFYHSYQQFADECNLSTRWVKKAVSFLKDNGYIEFESGKGSKSPNTYHLLNSEVEFTIDSVTVNQLIGHSEPTVVQNLHHSSAEFAPQDNNSEVEFTIDSEVQDTNNSEVEFTINSEVEFTQKEYIKEKGNNINNNSIYKEEMKKEIKNNGKLNRKVEVNNDFSSFDIFDDVERMSVGECGTASTMKEEKNKAKATHTVQVGETTYLVSESPLDYDYIFSTMPQVTPSISSESGTGGDNSSTMDNCTTPTLKTAQDANMDEGHLTIDELETQFNYIPTATADDSVNLPKYITADMVRGIDWSDLKRYNPNAELITEAANTQSCFIDAVNKANELIMTWRRPFIAACDVYWNAKELIEEATLSDKAKNYATDALKQLKASLHCVGGDEMLSLRK